MTRTNDSLSATKRVFEFRLYVSLPGGFTSGVEAVYKQQMCAEVAMEWDTNPIGVWSTMRLVGDCMLCLSICLASLAPLA